MKKTIFYEKKADCCGCGACANICPVNIVEMVSDEEGFVYPRLKDPCACIGCRKCENVCPIIHASEINSNFVKAFAGWSQDDSCVSSSSGGAAYVFGTQILLQGGVVYGVKYTDDQKAAIYTRVANVEELKKTQTSKYIQSRKNDIYNQIKLDLKEERTVLFIGLPCDTFAVKKYAEKIDGKLITISLICHGPTSELVHKSFLEKIENKYQSPVRDVNVRYKKNAHWKPYYIRIRLQNGKEWVKKFSHTEYEVAFQNFKRPSCYYCHFKNDKYCADILIGDFHSAQKGTEEYNERGVSTILPLTEKGKDLLNQIENKFVLHEVDLNRSISQRAVHSSAKQNINRFAFADVLNRKGLKSACRNRDVRKSNNIKKIKRIVFSIKSAIYGIMKRLKFV